MPTTSSPQNSKGFSRGVISFLIICFTWSWVSLAIAHLLGFSLDNPVVQLGTMALVPAASAAIVRWKVSKEGFADAGLHLCLRQSWRSYLAAFVIPTAVLITGIIIAMSTGLWDSSQGFNTRALAMTIISGPIVAVASSVIFFGEEFGWTAYLRDRLLPGRPIATTFATGIVWGVWHFPLPWVGYFGGSTSISDVFWAMLLWLPLSVLLELLIGWLWSESKSVWPGAILHAGCNLVASVGMDQVFGQQLSVTTVTIIYCASLVPFALGVIMTGHLNRTRNSP